MSALALLASLTLCAPSSTPVVTVLYFDNATTDPELDVLRKGLADLMITDLVAWEGVRVVEREKLQSVLKELELQQSKAVDPKTAVKIGKVLGAQYLITGSLSLSKGSLIVDARVVRAETGESVVATRASGPRDSIFDLEQKLVLELTAGINLKLSDDGARRKVKVPDYAALLAYAKALDLSDLGKLEEAQRAMQQLVSSAPTFLLARERRSSLLAAFQKYEKEKAETLGVAALELGRRASEALKVEFGAAKTQEEQEAHLSWRAIYARFLARSLLRSYATHSEHLKLVLPGKEGEALIAMRAWVANQRALEAESAVFGRAHPIRVQEGVIDGLASARVAPDVQRLLDEAGWKELGGRAALEARVSFVLRGELVDENPVRVAPALGWVDENERTAALRDLDAAIVAHTPKPGAAVPRLEESRLTSLLESKAQIFIDAGDVEGAVKAYQGILDAFPTGFRAEWAEQEINRLLEGRSPRLRLLEVWSRAITTCDAMSMNVGAPLIDQRLVRGGRGAYAAMAAEIEKACPVNSKNRSSYSHFYEQLGMNALTQDDCTSAMAWLTKAIDHGYSVNDITTWLSRSPWCSATALQASAEWFVVTETQKGSLESDARDLEFESLSARLADTGNRLVISGSRGAGELRQTVNLTLAKGPAGWSCAFVDWSKRGSSVRGTCEATLTTLSAGKGGFDEGTFSATFTSAEKGQLESWTQGRFHVRRE